MQKVVIILVLLFLGFVAGKYASHSEKENIKFLTPLSKGTLGTKKFEPYSFESLKKQTYAGSEIEIDKALEEGDEVTSYLFFYTVRGKKVSGMLHIPTKSGTYPVIVMARGFVDRGVYETGTGTKRAGSYFASSGYITIAPDFLGYGSSDKGYNDSLEDRFMTYTTVLELIASVKNLQPALEKAEIRDITVQPDKIGLWGHSNGGHIVLSVLEISGASYPAVLWAPVSKPFPYSILYYTDEYDDYGKALRKVVADFEVEYDSDKFSQSAYIDWLRAPIELHQGTADDAVPVGWSDELYNTLKEKDLEIEYFTYPGADHNLAPNGWDTAVERNVSFYDKWLKQ